MAVVENVCMDVRDEWSNFFVEFCGLSDRAFDILEKMRGRILCFKGDIQCTGAVVLTGFINEMPVPKMNLRCIFFVWVVSTWRGGDDSETHRGRSQSQQRGAFKAVNLVNSKGFVTTNLATSHLRRSSLRQDRRNI